MTALLRAGLLLLVTSTAVHMLIPLIIAERPKCSPSKPLAPLPSADRLRACSLFVAACAGDAFSRCPGKTQSPARSVFHAVRPNTVSYARARFCTERSLDFIQFGGMGACILFAY